MRRCGSSSPRSPSPWPSVVWGTPRLVASPGLLAAAASKAGRYTAEGRGGAGEGSGQSGREVLLRGVRGMWTRPEVHEEGSMFRLVSVKASVS